MRLQVLGNGRFAERCVSPWPARVEDADMAARKIEAGAP